MRFDFRLIKAMRAYEAAINKSHCLSYNGAVPKDCEKYIKRIHRWSGEIIASQQPTEKDDESK